MFTTVGIIANRRCFNGYSYTGNNNYMYNSSNFIFTRGEGGEVMEQLNTIQKREKLNEIFTVGAKGNGSAYHQYIIMKSSAIRGEELEKPTVGKIIFQNGARKEENSIHGVIDSDLLEIVRHRLQCFQEGDFATRENAIALTHIEEALLWMNKRVEDRIERNVLGTMNE